VVTANGGGSIRSLDLGSVDRERIHLCTHVYRKLCKMGNSTIYKKLVNERLSMANLKKFQLLYQGANDRDLLAQFRGKYKRLNETP